MAAALLAILTGLLDLLIAQDSGTPLSVILATALAAACLAVVTPFDASAPPERRRVVIACALFVAMIAVALVCAVLFSRDAGPLGGMVALIAAGVALLVWAFRTRNRVRRSMWSDYYDR